MSAQPYYSQVLASQRANGTLFNTFTTAKSILNVTELGPIPGNYLQVGSKLRVRMSGGLSNIVTTPGTVTFQIMMGAIVVWTSGAVQLSLAVPQDLIIPFTCTLREVDIVTQGGTGSCTVTLWKAGSLALPNSGNDMTGGTPPAISSGTVYNNTTLTGWTTSLTQNDRILCTLSANSTFTSVKIILRMY